MKVLMAAQFLALLIFSSHSLSATVEYQHPNLTIVATDEPLDAVLKSVGMEMRIFISVPTGFNPKVTVNIQQQSLQRAMKILLKDMSYSLEWEKGTERLAGLTILGNGGAASVAVDENRASQSKSSRSPAGLPSSDGPITRASTPSAPRQSEMADRDANTAEQDAHLAEEQAEMDARMTEERAELEARMQEDVARHDAEHAADLEAFLNEKGLTMPH